MSCSEQVELALALSEAIERTSQYVLLLYLSKIYILDFCESKPTHIKFFVRDKVSTTLQKAQQKWTTDP